MRGPYLLHTHHGGYSRQRRAHPRSGFVDPSTAKPVTLQYCTSLRVCVCVRCNLVLLPHKRRRIGLPISEPPRAESPCTPSVSLRWCSQRSTPLVAGARARTAWHFHAPAPCTVRPETLEAEHSLIKLKRSRRLPLCGWAAFRAIMWAAAASFAHRGGPEARSMTCVDCANSLFPPQERNCASADAQSSVAACRSRDRRPSCDSSDRGLLVLLPCPQPPRPPAPCRW